MTDGTHDYIRARWSKSAMRLGRRLFRNTPLQRLRITSVIYERLAKTAFGDGGYVTVSFRDHQFDLPAGDITTLPSLADGTYETDELDHFLALVRPGMVAVDIGANIGIWSVLLSDAVGADGRVFAFEPSPTNATLLRANLARNGCSNVVVVEAAAGRAQGHGALDTSSPGATHRMTNDPTDADTAVDVVALDEFLLERKIDAEVVKIDVEGYEPEAIAGMWHLMNTCRAFLTEYSRSQSVAVGTSWASPMERLVEIFDECEVFDGRSVRLLESTDVDQILQSDKLLNLLFMRDR